MQQVIKPIMRYPGAKWTMVDWITHYMPAMPMYAEPFCGSAAVYLNLPWKPKHTTLNDLSGDICNLFRVIREDGERLAALLEMTPRARAEYDLSNEVCDDPLERARRYLVHIWQSHSADGVRGKGAWSYGPKNVSGDGRAGLWNQLPVRIQLCIQKLRDVDDIENCDALELIERYARYPNALLYVDPPYLLETRSGGVQYKHEMTPSHHEQLLDALDRHPGPVVLSGYAHPLYDNRLADWQRQTKVMLAEKGNLREEILWLNPVCVERLGYGPLFAQEAN
jgi:DNA adenine methylase